MIYLDYQATTPLAPEVIAAMRPWIEDEFANPHAGHRAGRKAAAAIEAARSRIMAALGPGANAGRMFFTGSATEAANWAIKGGWDARAAGRSRIVTLATEHSCIHDSVLALAAHGAEPVIVPVGPDGLADPALLAAAIDERTAIVSVMLVNNEIGVVQDVPAIAALAHAAGARFVCDAVQGFGRVPLDPADCDMIVLGAHKIHGPKGVGALWVRRGCEPAPLLHGGGQEARIRSGTLSPMLCAGFGEAARLMAERREADAAHVAAARAALLDALGEGWTLNGAEHPRYAGNLNLRRPGLDAPRLISEVREVAFSTGSACTTGRPSRVLRAIGLDQRAARGSIRLGFGRYTTVDDAIRGGRLIRDGALRQTGVA